MSIDLEKEREAFEKKQAERYIRPENVLRKSEEGAYVSDFIHSAFQGWLERAELAQAEINDLKQQIAELHASRESLLAYKDKLENPDYVLVPIKLNREMYDAMSNHLYGCCGGASIDEEDTWHDVIRASQ